MSQEMCMESTDVASRRAHLAVRHPGRDDQITSLSHLFLHPSQPLPPSVHLHDPSNASRQATRLIRDLLHDAVSTTSLHINPLTCPSTRHVFARLLTFVTSLNGASNADALKVTYDPSEESLNYLLEQLSRRVRVTRKGTSGGMAIRLVIVVEQAERMRDIWTESLCAAIFHLAERTSLLGTLGVVTVSTLGIHHFRSSSGSVSQHSPMGTISIPFGRLEKEHTCSLLRIALQPHTKEDTPLLSTFVSIAYDTFASDLRDFEELRQCVAKAWPSFIQPIVDAKVSSGATQAHIVRGTKILRGALSQLHDPDPPTTPFQGGNDFRAQTSSPSLCACFVMLASFLASYNPPRLDTRYFLRNEASVSSLERDARGTVPHRRRKGGALRKVRRGRPPKRSGNAYEEQTQLYGPRSFSCDRMLNIFQSLLIEAAPSLHHRRRDGEDGGQGEGERWEIKGKGGEVLQSINSLLKTGYLVRTSLVDKLDVYSTLRTNVSRDTAQRIARDVGVSMEHYFLH